MASHNEAGTFDAVDDALAMFHQMDSDQNGSLDLSEMQYMLADFGLSEVHFPSLHFSSAQLSSHVSHPHLVFPGGHRELIDQAGREQRRLCGSKGMGSRVQIAPVDCGRKRAARMASDTGPWTVVSEASPVGTHSRSIQEADGCDAAH